MPPDRSRRCARRGAWWRSARGPGRRWRCGSSAAGTRSACPRRPARPPRRCRCTRSGRAASRQSRPRRVVACAQARQSRQPHRRRRGARYSPRVPAPARPRCRVACGLGTASARSRPEPSAPCPACCCCPTSPTRSASPAAARRLHRLRPQGVGRGVQPGRRPGQRPLDATRTARAAPSYPRRPAPRRGLRAALLGPDAPQWLAGRLGRRGLPRLRDGLLASSRCPTSRMPAEITDDYDERTRLMTWRVAILALAILVSGGASPAIRDAFGPAGATASWRLFVAVAHRARRARCVARHPAAPVRTAASPSREPSATSCGSVRSGRPFRLLLIDLRAPGARDRCDARRGRLRGPLVFGDPGAVDDPVRLLRRARRSS